MNPLLRSLIIFLFPAQCRVCEGNLDPSDGYYICKSCWEQAEYIKKPFCEKCGYPLLQNIALPEKILSCSKCPDSPYFRKARPIANYESAVGEAIKLLKYSGKEIMAKPLSELMFSSMQRLLPGEDYDLIVPVPLHKKKKRKRGYNQMDLIGRRLSQLTGIPIETDSLVKIKDNEPQVGLSDNKRLENVKGVYDVKEPSLISGKRVLLIDDVMTTGATINECAKILMRQGKVKYVDVFTLTRRLLE